MAGKRKPQQAASSSGGPSKVSFDLSPPSSSQPSTSTALSTMVTRSMTASRPMTRSQTRSGSTPRDIASFSARASREPSVTRTVRRDRSRSRSRTPAPRAASEPAQTKKKFQVEAILDQMQLKNGTRKFRIKWVGFDERANEWVHEKNMHCPELIKKFDDDLEKERRFRESSADSEDAESTADSDAAQLTCRACNPLDSDHASYTHKRNPLKYEATEWVGCEYCRAWFHIECVDEESWHLPYIDHFACLDCRQHHDLTMHSVVAPHRKKFFDMAERTEPTEVGTKTWMLTVFKQWDSQQFGELPATHGEIFLYGEKFMERFEKDVIEPEANWEKVYVVKKKDGLKMKVPAAIDLNFIINLLGKTTIVPVIDVYRQESTHMSLGTYRDLATADNRPFLFNILSLEFTGTRLARHIDAPQMAKDLSWVKRYWPKGQGQNLSTRDPKHLKISPKLEYFCLMGMGGSYTDFHLDHGGSSVYYHIHTGKKVFYIVEGTTENLGIYEKHLLDKNSSTKFLGDVFPREKIWKVVLEAGDTLLLPAGYIHAVYTPVDSLVFGGNFLTDQSVHLQCETFAHEARARQPTYPNFRMMNCYAARTFSQKLRDHNQKSKSKNELPRNFLQGVKSLIDALDRWIDMDRSGEESEDAYASVGPDEPFIHGESQRDILRNLKTEFHLLNVSLPAPSASFPMDDGPSTSSASRAGGNDEPARKRAKLTGGFGANLSKK